MSAEFGSLRTIRARRGLLDLCEADDKTISIIAQALDLPMDDSETVSFLTDAFKEAAHNIEVCMAHEKLASLEGTKL